MSTGQRLPAPPVAVVARRRGVHGLTVAVLLIGLAATAGLTTASHLAYVHNEQRLVALQTQLTASAVDIAPVDVERRLGQAAAAAAEATDPAAAFARQISGSMSPRGPFVVAALFQMRGGSAHLLDLTGERPLFKPSSAESISLITAATKSSQLQTIWRVKGKQQRFGYALSAAGPAGTFVVSAGQSLPQRDRAAIPKSSPDAGFDYALYFGRTTSAQALIETSASHLPLGGTSSTATVPFGSNALTLVLSPRTPLAGVWSASIAWGILAVGLLLSIAIATLVERLLRRQEYSALLAGENRRLYQEQRKVAETLQHSLLPESLPARAEVEVAVRYLPGTTGLDVGGDWYDLLEVGEGQLFFSVGDVSGRGLSAAALMSRLRNAITAFASDGLGPATVLDKVSRLVDVARDGRFATVLCGLLELSSGKVVIANAGHPEPLLIEDERRSFVKTDLGPPVGVATAGYSSVNFTLQPGGTLLAFTDGLVERRDEPLSTSLERLRQAASPELSLHELLDDILSALVPSGAADDVAILGLRWKA